MDQLMNVERKFKPHAIALFLVGYGAIVVSIVYSFVTIFVNRAASPTQVHTIDTRTNGGWGPLPYVLVSFWDPNGGSCPQQESITCQLMDSVWVNEATGKEVRPDPQATDGIAATGAEAGIQIYPEWASDYDNGKQTSRSRGCHVLVDASMWSPKDVHVTFQCSFLNVGSQTVNVYTAGHGTSNTSDMNMFVHQFPHVHDPNVAYFQNARMTKAVIPTPGVFMGWPGEKPQSQEVVDLELVNTDALAMTMDIFQLTLSVGNPIISAVETVSIFAQCKAALGTLGGCLFFVGSVFLFLFVPKFAMGEEQKRQATLTLRGFGGVELSESVERPLIDATSTKPPGHEDGPTPPRVKHQNSYPKLLGGLRFPAGMAVKPNHKDDPTTNGDA